MARVRRHDRISNSLGSRFIFRRRRSWWCAWFPPTPATIRRYDGLEMGPSDRKSPFLLQFWALDPNSYPKIHHSKYHLRLERHRLLFDELVLGQDQLLRGCYFFGPLRRRDRAKKKTWFGSHHITLLPAQRGWPTFP